MLNGKVAVVTGGTRGIGYGIVKTYLDNGAIVILCGSKKETVDHALSQLKSENPDYQVEGIYPVLSCPDEIKTAFETIKETHGSIDILVNNAGIAARDKIYEYDMEDFKKIMDINVNSIFNCSQVVSSIMKEQGGGVILNTSSMVSFYGQTSGCGYPASKFAVNGITKSLARELGKDNIRVNAVSPGITYTDMMMNVPEAMIKPLIAQIPLGRIGQVEDVANAFLYLASDMASYVTGAVLPVDGAARS